MTTVINNPMNQSELEANTGSRRKARKNVCEQVTIGFGFTSDWSRDILANHVTMQSVPLQNESNFGITFDSQLKTSLWCR